MEEGLYIPLHAWDVNPSEAIHIQENLRNRLILKKTFTEIKTIGGGDVSYSKSKNLLFASIVIFSFPKLEILEIQGEKGETSFPYIPGLLSFREGPILIRVFQRLKIKPDVMIFDGQGIAHPREFGLASHLGLWLDLSSIGCAKTPLLKEFLYPGPLKGNYKLIQKDGKELGAVLRTKDKVKPLFISPGHKIDLQTSIQIILASCRQFRLPEPLRKAHQASQMML